MINSMFELKKLYEMLGTVASKEYEEQVQKVCNAFYEDGKAT